MKCNLFTSTRGSFSNTIAVAGSRPSSGKTKAGKNKIKKKEDSVEKQGIVCGGGRGGKGLGVLGRVTS